MGGITLKFYGFRIKPVIAARIKKKCLLLSFLVLLFLMCILLATANGEDTAISTFSKVHYPIKSVQTERKSFSLTANVSAETKERDLRLLCDVCNGLDVPVCFFLSVDLLENAVLTDYITESGHYLGLYIDEDLSAYSRSETMRRIAIQNDVFFTLTGKYPKYVRLASEADTKASEVLNAYCQYHIASSVTISEADSKALQQGDIVEIVSVDSESPYLTAEFLTKALKNGLEPITLKELLHDIESEVDENGLQITQSAS